MSDLDDYRSKRRFSETPEPLGETVRSDTGRIFVVQQHDATRMHYDLRLEFDGALKSWAVPGGPTLDPKIKRLAIRTEDHPLNYYEFEGIIPTGQYGAGNMIVWDRGEWTPVGDAESDLEKGELKFRLYGAKIRGGFMLKRLKTKSKEWLLIKERDDEARPEEEFMVVDAMPESVISGLRVDELVALPAEPPTKVSVATLNGAVNAPFNSNPLPLLPTAVQLPPDGDDWLHEIKYDGYRVHCVLEDGAARIITRNGHDWTKKFEALANSFETLGLPDCILDGEAVVQDVAGKSDFGLLQKALAEHDSRLITFFAFDIRYYDGYAIDACRFADRRRLLEWVLYDCIDANTPIQISEIANVPGPKLFERACDLGLEGIVSKKTVSLYSEGRSTDWVKTKRTDITECVVLGYIQNENRVASLILGKDLGDELKYIGKAGSGLSAGDAELIKAQTEAAPPKSLPPIANAVFIARKLEARVSHRGWTKSGMLRQAAVMRLSPRRVVKRAPSLFSDQDLANIRITNPERILFDSDTTKLDLAVYYARVGDLMLPHIVNRPISFVRNPSGKSDDSFFQRHAFEGLPEGVARVTVPGKEKGEYLVIEEPSAFLALAQFGVIEFHPWACRADLLERPDRLVIDLDPDEDIERNTVVAAAQAVGDLLRELGLTPFLRTTGGKGLHVVAPISRCQDWKTFSDFAYAFVKSLENDAPRQFTTSPSKTDRKNRIYLDHLRNRKGATAIASYSARARTGVPIAVNIEWRNVQQLVNGEPYTVERVVNNEIRLAPDPWVDIELSAVPLSAKAKRHVGMMDR